MQDMTTPVTKEQLAARWGETVKAYHTGEIPYSVYIWRNYDIMLEAIQGGLSWIEVCKTDFKIVQQQ